ncbi:hypothetical protein ACFOOM_01075 [Streptomyces echinoruber]|uniref:Uncharacterized protein n=1 Tax=Streptomyces echinoruber TaxID=68898 RepID=A0A918QVV1_9ACTN|nr:hypothetical protein [Streptomyces echinoruber]GGZ73098.1 hypothetical protein GCM10010389_08190 [Streptomyces echinoruber]
MPIYLAEYELRADDPAKRDLELVHTRCGDRLCDAEPGDHMEMLFAVLVEHAAACPL